MASPTFTERRLYRNARLLMGFQSAESVPVVDFSGAASRSLWARRFAFDPQIEKGDDQGTTGTPLKRSDARWLDNLLPVATFIGPATPRSLEWILRAWGGTWAGSPTMTLAVTDVLNEYSTLALVEKVPVPNPQQLLRTWDAWPWRVAIRMYDELGPLELEAEFVCRDFDRTPLNALGGITLPASLAPTPISAFTPHYFRLFRDPAGANVSLAARELEIRLEHLVAHENWQDRAPRVTKLGETKISVALRGIWQDETLAIETDLESQATTFRRFQALWSDAARNFQLDMRNVDFIASPTGWEDGRFKEFTVEGEAYFDGTNWVAITLTP